MFPFRFPTRKMSPVQNDPSPSPPPPPPPLIQNQPYPTEIFIVNREAPSNRLLENSPPPAARPFTPDQTTTSDVSSNDDGTSTQGSTIQEELYSSIVEYGPPNASIISR